MSKPIIIAGPCMAEDPHMMEDVAAEMKEGLAKLNVDYYFKASYDKANRTTKSSERGPGLVTGLQWLSRVKEKHEVKLLTDVHEAHQCGPVGEVVDVVQIPAMLCRQTDLIVAAADTGKIVNIKKGQFASPQAMIAAASKSLSKTWVCERGSMFGYGDLVVDMRGLKIMSDGGCEVILDMTHCTQRPPSGSKLASGAAREFAPLLARAAAATGYISGIFMEVHPEPRRALSDGPAMLTPGQAILVIKNILEIMNQAEVWRATDYLVKGDAIDV
jgi:2-dehydro-3-deoxyphosphooctonate aldolase (KDO 8-P synthase)